MFTISMITIAMIICIIIHLSNWEAVESHPTSQARLGRDRCSQRCNFPSPVGGSKYLQNWWYLKVALTSQRISFTRFPIIPKYPTFLLVSPAAASQPGRPRQPQALHPASYQRRQHHCDRSHFCHRGMIILLVYGGLDDCSKAACNEVTSAKIARISRFGDFALAVEKIFINLTANIGKDFKDGWFGNLAKIFD